MSRSKKHSPISGHTCVGGNAGIEAFFKRRARRRLRHQQESELRELGEILTITSRELDDPWLWPKDGKSRFDPLEHPEWMRK